jgi:hypothetical protein
MRRSAAENVANLRAGVERVVISWTTIEIELVEGMVADDQNRVRIRRRRRRIDGARSSRARANSSPQRGR